MGADISWMFSVPMGGERMERGRWLGTEHHTGITIFGARNGYQYFMNVVAEMDDGRVEWTTDFRIHMD